MGFLSEEGMILSTMLSIIPWVLQFSPIWKSFQQSFESWWDDYSAWKKEAPQTFFSLEQDVSISCSASQVAIVSGNKKKDPFCPSPTHSNLPSTWVDEGHWEMWWKCLRLRGSQSASEIQLSYGTAASPPKTRENACVSLLSTVGKGQSEKRTLWFSPNHCTSTKMDIIAMNLGQRHQIAMWPWPSYSTTPNSIFLKNKDNTHPWDCLGVGACGGGQWPLPGMEVGEHS